MTPNGALVTCSGERWKTIAEKHPVLAEHAADVRAAIEHADEIRLSRWDPGIWLCYRRQHSRLLCAVIAPASGVLVTAYPTDSMKAGEVVWTRSA